MRILLVEDDADLSYGVATAFEKLGYRVDQASNGAEADHFLTVQPYDLVLLDLGLPKMDGLEVLRRLRRRHAQIPVLILTARDSVEERIEGLDAGADDYLVKPFDMQELAARVRALLRRNTESNQSVLTNGPLSVDTAKHIATIGGNVVTLSPRDFVLLELFAYNKGKVLRKEDLIERFSDWDKEIGENAIEVAVFRLRKKLGSHGIHIKTVRGAGYLMEEAHV